MNYRPVSNLRFIAKILEKLVLSQVSSYLNSHNLYNACQSAYSPGHSTETAIPKVVNDLFLSLSKGNISVLALLDVSSAFDIVDHPILVHRLHAEFGFTDTVLQWFSSYLTDRTHFICLSNHCSAHAPVHSGVPQGSVLGPILFTMYIKPLSAIIDSHSIMHHSFADDLQLLMSAPLREYLSYFILCSHAQVMSMLGQCIVHKKVTSINHDCMPSLMLLHTMLYIVLAYLMLFAALSNTVCLDNVIFKFISCY